MGVITIGSLILLGASIIYYEIQVKNSKSEKMNRHERINKCVMLISALAVSISYSYFISDTIVDFIIIGICSSIAFIGLLVFLLFFIDVKLNYVLFIVLCVIFALTFWITSTRGLVNISIISLSAVFGTVIGYSLKNKYWKLLICAAIALSISFSSIYYIIDTSIPKSKVDSVAIDYIENELGLEVDDISIYPKFGLRGDNISIRVFAENAVGLVTYEMIYFEGNIIRCEEITIRQDY